MLLDIIARVRADLRIEGESFGFQSQKNELYYKAIF